MENDVFFAKMKESFSELLPGTQLFLYDSIDSTNNQAKNYANADKDAPDAFFIARAQSAGRGRMGRSFLSGDGGLYMSYLLHPKLSASDTLKLTVFSAVCLCEVIEEMTDIKPQIKWVNDVFAKGKKLAGILTEGVFFEGDNTFKYAVIGIGVNLKKTEFPPELEELATDIESVASSTPDIAVFASKLAKKLSAFRESETLIYMQKYRSLSAVIGKRVQAICPTGNFYADVVDIDDDGALIVMNDAKEEKRLISGEISIKM